MIFASMICIDTSLYSSPITSTYPAPCWRLPSLTGRMFLLSLRDALRPCLIINVDVGLIFDWTEALIIKDFLLDLNTMLSFVKQYLLSLDLIQLLLHTTLLHALLLFTPNYSGEGPEKECHQKAKRQIRGHVRRTPYLIVWYLGMFNGQKRDRKEPIWNHFGRKKIIC